MFGVEYIRSVPRFMAARYLGPRWGWVYTSALGTIRLKEVPRLSLPNPHWVRVRPRIAGICGSDLATITAKGSTYFSAFTSFPFVFGHEVVGDVTEVGSAVKTVSTGDRIVLQPPLHCQVRGIEELCRECQSGRHAHCLNITRGNISAGVQTGFCRDTGGGWSEEFVAHESQLHPVPETLEDRVAVLVEPFSCCLHAARLAAPADDETVLVIGCGTIGLLTILAIRSAGSRCRIVAIAKYPHQQRAAEKLGANTLLSPGRNLFAEIGGMVGSEVYRPELSRPLLLGGFDICFDCIGSSLSLDDALRLTRNRGKVLLVGMPGVPQGVDWTSIWYKELLVEGSYTSDTGTFRDSIRLVGEHAGELSGIVNAEFSLHQYREAIQTALNAGPRGALKTVFVT